MGILRKKLSEYKVVKIVGLDPHTVDLRPNRNVDRLTRESEVG